MPLSESAVDDSFSGRTHLAMITRYGPCCSQEELIHAAGLGSREAFDELVHRFRDEMIGVACRATGSREAAEDIVQDAFLQAFRALPTLQDPAKFAGWLAVITRYRARRVGARDRRCEPTEAVALERLLFDREGERTLSIAEQWLRASESAEVRAALAKLPWEYRVV